MSHDIEAIDEQMKKLRDMRAKLFEQRISELAGIYGSVRAVGQALNIDHAYLHRLANGEKQNPSKVVLRKLGLAF
jgi:hypothetical protein